MSLSARRAWIEITVLVRSSEAKTVALRKESVDRNKDTSLIANIRYQVALRKESVDRNLVHVSVECVEVRSLSARRAWIEMIVRKNQVTLQ